MIAHVIKIFFLGSLIIFNAAHADVLYLNQKGQDELETTPVPKEGIVRKIDMQERTLYWQPYRKNWEWEDDYIEIDLSWIALLKPEIDTIKDIKTNLRLLEEFMKTGFQIPKYDDMFRGAYGLFEGFMEFMVKCELNNMEEPEPGVYQAVKQAANDLIVEYAKYRNTDPLSFPDPTTPAGRRATYSNFIFNNVYTSFVLAFNDDLDAIHFSKTPYNFKNFLIDPRLMALKAYEYAPLVWKEYKTENSDIALQFIHNAFLEGSTKNLEPKYAQREAQIRKQSPIMLKKYYKAYPDHIDSHLKGLVMLDGVRYNSPFFPYKKHVFMRNIFFEIASASDVEKMVDNIIYWNLEPDLSDGYSPDPFFLELLQELLANRSEAVQKLSLIIQDKQDRLRGADPDDLGWPELKFLQGLIVTP